MKVWLWKVMFFLPSESTRPPSLPDWEGHMCGLWLQWNAYDRGTATSVQSWATHHHVPYPGVQMVGHAPATAHWPAVCTGERRPCVEEVCEVVYVNLRETEKGGWAWCLLLYSDRPSAAELTHHFIAAGDLWWILFIFPHMPPWFMHELYSNNVRNTNPVCFSPPQPLHQICYGLCQ